MTHLTAKQKQAINALMRYPTLDQVAENAGVSRRTIYRWLDNPDFRRELSRAEAEALDRTTRKLIILGDHAVNALADVLKNPQQRGANNLRLAAQTILSNLIRLHDQRSLEARLQVIEDKLGL